MDDNRLCLLWKQGMRKYGASVLPWQFPQEASQKKLAASQGGKQRHDLTLLQQHLARGKMCFGATSGNSVGTGIHQLQRLNLFVFDV